MALRTADAGYGAAPAAQKDGTSSCDESSRHDPNTLPVFYYNDFLVSRIGQRMGLNLFEPRYKIMCQRMRHDPRFLFMPNFTNYQCAVADVGFVMQLTNLRQGHGGAYGIEATSVEMVAVQCMWVEPGTKGLHYAHFCNLPQDLYHFTGAHGEMEKLCRSLVSADWFGEDAGDGAGIYFTHKRTPGLKLLLSCNWDDACYHLLLQKQGELTPEDRKAVEDGLKPFGGDAMAKLHVLPCPPPSVPLRPVFDDIVDMIHQDGKELPFRQDGRCAVNVLDGLVIANISDTPGMDGYLPMAAVELCHVPVEAVCESLPWVRVTGRSHKAVIRVVNGSNIHFFTLPELATVTRESAQAAISNVAWKLNALRLSILKRSRQSGLGAFAALEDDVADLVCSFIAERPL